MTTQDAFNAAQFAYMAYDAFFEAVAQQVGREQALALEEGALVPLGAAQGQMIKEQAGAGEIDAQATYAMLMEAIATIGISAELLQASPERVAFKPGRCPIYEAALALGWDQERIETACRSSSIPFMDAALKQLNPDLDYRLTSFRSGPNDSCVEEIVRSD
jgi:hypothetical protein